MFFSLDTAGPVKQEWENTASVAAFVPGKAICERRIKIQFDRLPVVCAAVV